DRWAQDGSTRWIGLATACAALACLARYASAVLMPVGLLALLFAPPRGLPDGLRSRVAAALGFVVVAALPIVLWMARNMRLGLGPVGAEAGGGFSWSALALQMSNAASHWVSPESSPPWVRIAALGCFVAAIVGTLVLAFRRAPWTREEHFPPL